MKVGVGVGLLVVFLASCARIKPLPVLGTIPQFELISSTGQAFDSHSLDGHVWVANFIYTTCDGPCPMMSHKMKGIQESTVSSPGLKLVSFTVDPKHDTPEVLAKYAKFFKADGSRWFFLTGEMSRLNDLGLNGFKVNGVNGDLSHSMRFVLVDQKRRMRGTYMTSDDDFPQRLLHDIKQLEADQS